MSVGSELHEQDGQPLLVWRFPAPATVASTAACGGGVGERLWVINAQVPRDYARHDLDIHGAELAAGAELSGPGVVMFTAARVREVERAVEEDVYVEATVGLTHPSWAAADEVDDVAAAGGPGTINIVVQLPVRLDPGALLNALCTATEAKTQALLEVGFAGTGTPSDAVTVVGPSTGPIELFAGPRSPWGARVARAVHAAVYAGSLAWLARGD
jgi:adenosylcobinamide amidohydrolase